HPRGVDEHRAFPLLGDPGPVLGRLPHPLHVDSRSRNSHFLRQPCAPLRLRPRPDHEYLAPLSCHRPQRRPLLPRRSHASLSRCAAFLVFSYPRHFHNPSFNARPPCPSPDPSALLHHLFLRRHGETSSPCLVDRRIPLARLRQLRIPIHRHDLAGLLSMGAP